MARKVAFVVMSVGAWLGVGLLSGCNEILDIQQADLGAIAGGSANAGAGAGAGGGSPIPTDETCKADNSACSKCLSTSCDPVARGQCIRDEGCRKIGDHYARCLGPQCKADEVGCFGPLTAGDSLVPPCVESCFSECAAVPVYSACELYCGCMVANCVGKFDSVQECVDNCKTLDPEVVSCRRTHCDIAPHDSKLPHCDHAVGLQTCSATTPPVRPTTCRNKSLKGFYCATGGDCCSGACDPSKAACVDP
jgi:hypothetical protein